MDRFNAFLDSNVVSLPGGVEELPHVACTARVIPRTVVRQGPRRVDGAVHRDFPDVTREQLERTRDLMNLHAQDSLVNGFEGLIESLELPDPNDRHVLAAATRSGTDDRDTEFEGFSEGETTPLWHRGAAPGHVYHALFDLNPGAVVGAAQEHRASLKNPPKSVDEYLETLERQGLTQTVAELRGYASVL